jgi:hypothetical protein
MYDKRGGCIRMGMYQNVYIRKLVNVLRCVCVNVDVLENECGCDNGYT